MAKRDGYRDATGIVVGQVVSGATVERARELRQQQTSAEVRLWDALRGGRLNGQRFRRQQPIDGFIVDSYCHATHLVIEVDGGIHDAQRGHDETRDQLLAGRGLSILRVTNDDVLTRLDHVLSQISLACTNPTPKK